MHRTTALVTLALAAIAAPVAASPRRPVPGTVGLDRRELTLRDACAPSFSQILVRRRGDDRALVKALTWPRIGGLDFDPERKARAAASLKRFDAWIRGMTAAFQGAIEAQQRIVTDPAARAGARVEAAARATLLLDQMAAVLRSLEVPANIRSFPEAVEVYCETLDEKAEPVEAQAGAMRATCAGLAATVGAGWWSEVCPAAAATP